MLPLVITLTRTAVSSSIATACTAWLGKFFARVVARQLQVPEALVRDASFYVYARIDLFERQLLSGLLGRS
jgi:hypothetical protein